jgi:hypothetical protein
VKLERTAYVLVVVGTGFAISSAFGSPPLNRIQALVACVMVFTAIGIDLWAIKRGRRPHKYLSTGCLHDEHEYCQGRTGLAGSKTPAQCKFCEAPCRCHCHKGYAVKPTFEDGAQKFFANAADLTEDEMQAYRDRWDAVHGKGEGE